MKLPPRFSFCAYSHRKNRIVNVLNDWNDWNGLNKLLGIESGMDFFIPVRYSVFYMGYLTEEFSDEIGRLSQQRGRQYFLSGAVKRIEGDALSINAVVQGTIQYDVTISSVDGFLD